MLETTFAQLLTWLSSHLSPVGLRLAMSNAGHLNDAWLYETKVNLLHFQLGVHLVTLFGDVATFASSDTAWDRLLHALLNALTLTTEQVTRLSGLFAQLRSANTSSTGAAPFPIVFLLQAQDAIGPSRTSADQEMAANINYYWQKSNHTPSPALNFFMSQLRPAAKPPAGAAPPLPPPPPPPQPPQPPQPPPQLPPAAPPQPPMPQVQPAAPQQAQMPMPPPVVVTAPVPSVPVFAPLPIVTASLPPRPQYHWPSDVSPPPVTSAMSSLPSSNASTPPITRATSPAPPAMYVPVLITGTPPLSPPPPTAAPAVPSLLHPGVGIADAAMHAGPPAPPHPHVFKAPTRETVPDMRNMPFRALHSPRAGAFSARLRIDTLHDALLKLDKANIPGLIAYRDTFNSSVDQLGPLAHSAISQVHVMERNPRFVAISPPSVTARRNKFLTEHLRRYFPEGYRGLAEYTRVPTLYGLLSVLYQNEKSPHPPLYARLQEHDPHQAFVDWATSRDHEGYHAFNDLKRSKLIEPQSSSTNSINQVFRGRAGHTPFQPDHFFAMRSRFRDLSATTPSSDAMHGFLSTLRDARSLPDSEIGRSIPYTDRLSYVGHELTYEAYEHIDAGDNFVAHQVPFSSESTIPLAQALGVPRSDLAQYLHENAVRLRAIEDQLHDIQLNKHNLSFIQLANGPTLGRLKPLYTDRVTLDIASVQSAISTNLCAAHGCIGIIATLDKLANRARHSLDESITEDYARLSKLLDLSPGAFNVAVSNAEGPMGWAAASLEPNMQPFGDSTWADAENKAMLRPAYADLSEAPHPPDTVEQRAFLVCLLPESLWQAAASVLVTDRADMKLLRLAKYFGAILRGVLYPTLPFWRQVQRFQLNNGVLQAATRYSYADGNPPHHGLAGISLKQLLAIVQHARV